MSVAQKVLHSVLELRSNRAFFGCFLAIWIGDFILYSIARFFGRRLLEKPWVARRVSAQSLARSETWFARRGPFVLFASRWIPGTRLATYLTAGFLRMPLVQFVPVTFVAAALWTTAVFTLIHSLGLERVAMLRQVGAFVIISVCLGAVAAVLMIRWLSRRLKTKIGWLLRHWEFWPAWGFYVPVALNYLWLSIRYRGLTLPTAANPGLYPERVLGTSKYAILDQLNRSHPEFTAEAWLIEAGTSEARLARLHEILREQRLMFPLILKPDVGQGGLGVRKIECLTEAEAYIKGFGESLVLQQYVEGPFEAGVFYVRHPECERGELFAITERHFPTVVGDGRTSLGELIRSDPKARDQARRYLRRFASRLHEVPGLGIRLPLAEAGNHALGCAFRDGIHWGSDELFERIDLISKSLPGFYIGRFDIRFENEADFVSGKSFRIVELNGASAEATSIYDSHKSVWSTYRTLFRQWQMVFEIGAWNRKQGTIPCSISDWCTRWKRTQERLDSFPTVDA
jgi:membrane protein DedA with SNARE-associated domain